MPTILYVEDDPAHRMMMHLTLRNTNFILIEATDGIEALQILGDQNVDLILLDLFMPRLDGFGVMEALKSNRATRYLPIIVLSAWPTGDNRQRARRAGAIDFVAKPYDPLELVKLISEHLRALTH